MALQSYNWRLKEVNIKELQTWTKENAMSETVYTSMLCMVRSSCNRHNVLGSAQYQPHPFCWVVETTFCPKFWKGEFRKKMSAWGDLKSTCHRYLPGGGGGLLCYLSKKTLLLVKIWHWELNFSCWSWTMLAKQPINI